MKITLFFFFKNFFAAFPEKVSNTRAHGRGHAPKHTHIHMRASAHTFGCQLKITFHDAFEYNEQQL